MSAHLDRAEARDVLASTYHASVPNELLDALEACVVPDPPQTINRDAYEALGNLREQVDEDHHGWIDADEFSRAFALVRPAAGITLTPEEADFIVSDLNGMLDEYGDSDDPDEQQANFYRRSLLAKLEEAA